MIEVIGTPIPDEEAKEMMRADLAALIMHDPDCPLAKAIDAALAVLDAAIASHEPS